MSEVGIDDISIYAPRLYLDLQDFAACRDEDYQKLHRGLGLSCMAIPDAHEDPATMGANAVRMLIDQNELDPRTIGRLYLGTESALDGSKPTATYIHEMLETYYEPKYGPHCLAHCDVVDLTFACISGVDALHNTLDWVARDEGEGRIGIVAFSDNAKYDIGSAGEYTQGAGAGALLIKNEPRLMVIPDNWGVSTKGVHDFFKPRRAVELSQVFENVLDLASECGLFVPENLSMEMLGAITTSPLADEGIFHFGHETIQLHKDTPVFDGQFSNHCYKNAVREAFIHFRDKATLKGEFVLESGDILTDKWDRIILHLPYAYQGKRMFPDVFRHERKDLPIWDEIQMEVGEDDTSRNDYPEGEVGDAEYRKASDHFRRLVSRTTYYKEFVANKIEKGQRASSLVGNQYTGSIFLAMMSTLESDFKEGVDLSGKRIGMCGYGSGSKAKVYEGVVQSKWKEVAHRFDLFDRLNARQALECVMYEGLHRGALKESILEPKGEFALVAIGTEGVNEGSRTYRWVE